MPVGGRSRMPQTSNVQQRLLPHDIMQEHHKNHNGHTPSTMGSKTPRRILQHVPQKREHNFTARNNPNHTTPNASHHTTHQTRTTMAYSSHLLTTIPATQSTKMHNRTVPADRQNNDISMEYKTTTLHRRPLRHGKLEYVARNRTHRHARDQRHRPE